MATDWSKALKQALSASEKQACVRMYELAEEYPELVIDAQTDELEATALLELACDDMDIPDGSDLYLVMEDCAAEIAIMYEKNGSL